MTSKTYANFEERFVKNHVLPAGWGSIHPELTKVWALFGRSHDSRNVLGASVSSNQKVREVSAFPGRQILAPVNVWEV